MNPTPTQIIAIGASFIFGIPIVAGLLAARFLGSVNGFITGVVVFLLILTMAHRKLTKLKKE